MDQQIKPKQTLIRELILHEYRKGESATKAVHIICQTQGEGAVNRRTCVNWYKKFDLGDFGTADQPRSGRPTVVDDDQLKDYISTNSASTSRKMSAVFGCDHKTIINHLHKLDYVNKRCQDVPHDLNKNQKEKRVYCCSDLLDRYEYCDFLDQIITCDEKWITYDNRYAHNQWILSGEKAAPAPRKSLHGKKAMLCIWWCSKGVIHFEIVPDGNAINSEVYVNQLQRVQEKIRRPPFAAHFRKGVLFLQDNARPHVSAITQEKLFQLKWAVLPHPPYSPDISPCDYYLFRSLEHFLRDKQFTEDNGIKSAIQSFIDSKAPEFWSNGIQKLPELWEKIIDSNGEYLI